MNPNPLDITDGTAIVSVSFIGTDTGLPSGGTQITGTTGASDLVLIFQLSVDTDSGGGAKTVEISVWETLPFFYNTTGTGTISGTGDVAVLSVPPAPGGTANTPRFDFLYGMDGAVVAAGESSDYFFISFASGTILADGTETIRFKVTADSSATPFAGNATIIPEPGSLLLLGMGMGFLGIRARRRRRA